MPFLRFLQCHFFFFFLRRGRERGEGGTHYVQALPSRMSTPMRAAKQRTPFNRPPFSFSAERREKERATLAGPWQPESLLYFCDKSTGLRLCQPVVPPVAPQRSPKYERVLRLEAALPTVQQPVAPRQEPSTSPTRPISASLEEVERLFSSMHAALQATQQHHRPLYRPSSPPAQQPAAALAAEEGDLQPLTGEGGGGQGEEDGADLFPAAGHVLLQPNGQAGTFSKALWELADDPPPQPSLFEGGAASGPPRLQSPGSRLTGLIDDTRQQISALRAIISAARFTPL